MAERTVESAQTVWEGPASEGSGMASLCITTVSVTAGQMPLLTVHTNVLVPAVRPETPVDREEGALMTAVPPAADHIPAPAVGDIADNVADVEQRVCETPASAGPGSANLKICIVSFTGAQGPLVMLQTKVFVPVTSEVTADVGLRLFEKAAFPGVDHMPLPMGGIDAASVAADIQTVWSAPADVSTG